MTGPNGARTAADALAARRVLDGDGSRFVLQPWQVAYLFALVEGRTPVVPPGCGVGKGWLDARLREARGGLADGPEIDGPGSASG